MARRSNGEGTIYKRTDGRWCAAYFVEYEKGKFKRKYVYGKTQKEVKEKLKELEEMQPQKKDAKLTLQDWMYKWMELYKKNVLKRTSYESYLDNIRVHISGTKIGKTELKKLTTDMLQEFYNEKINGSDTVKKLSRRTVEYIHTIIGSALEQAYRNEIIKVNYNNFTVLPKKEETEIVPLSLEELQKVLKYAEGTDMYSLLVLEVFTGMRKGEILGLQWKNIDFVEKVVHVRKNLCRVKGQEGERRTEFVLMDPKTKKSIRTIPLNDEVIRILKKHRAKQNEHKLRLGNVYQDHDLVFARADGTFEDPREILRRFHKVLERAGVRKCRFHDLRHTFASLLLNEGESMKTVQELLGHSSITTSMDIYSHLSDETKKKSIEVLGKVIKIS